MKKVLIGLSALVMLSFAVLLFVNAKSATLKSKKAATEAVAKCAATGECAGVKCEKAACNQTTCDQAKCDKKCDPATCPKAQTCPGLKEGCAKQTASSGCKSKCPMAQK